MCIYIEFCEVWFKVYINLVIYIIESEKGSERLMKILIGLYEINYLENYERVVVCVLLIYSCLCLVE